MAEILGLGLSHYPGPLVPAEHWPRMLQTNVENGRIPQDLYEDKSRWPEPMRQEWGDDEGVSAARVHRDRLLAGYRRLRDELDAFNPDLVLIWGDDQYENFKQDCIPAFCVYIQDEVVSTPLLGGARGPFRTDTNVWDLPPDTKFTTKSHRPAAEGLARALIEQEFDVAYALSARREEGLAHSFANTLVYLDYELKGFPYPVVPFHVNCYGSQMMRTAASALGEGSTRVLTPPSPTPRRCFEIGRATARYFRESPWRVALIASSSWSHGSLTEKHNRLYPDVEADRARFKDLSSNRFVEWDRLDPHQTDEAGQHELLNWICLAGAMSETGQKANVVDFVETYVFNSSKCFAVFPPVAASIKS